MADVYSKNPIQLQHKIKLRKMKPRNSISPVKIKVQNEGILKLFEVPSSPDPLGCYKMNKEKRYRNEIVRLFDWTGKTPESKYDEWDVDMDLVIKEIDEIVYNCKRSAPGQANHKQEVMFKKVRSTDRTNIIRKKRTKTSRSTSNLNELEILRRSIENKDRHETLSPDKYNLFQRNKSRNILLATPVKSSTRQTTRKSETKLGVTLSTTAIRKKSRSRQGSSNHLPRDKSPFEILADFNKNNKRYFDSVERPSFVNNTYLQKTMDASVPYSLLEEYQYELDKIKSIKKTCDKDFNIWKRDQQKRSPVKSRQGKISTVKQAVPKTDVSDSLWSKSFLKSHPDINTIDIQSTLRDQSDSNIFTKIDGIIAQMKAEQEKAQAYVL